LILSAPGAAVPSFLAGLNLTCSDAGPITPSTFLCVDGVQPGGFTCRACRGDTDVPLAISQPGSDNAPNLFDALTAEVHTDTAYAATPGQAMTTFNLGDICPLRLGAGGCGAGGVLTSDLAGRGVLAAATSWAGAVALQAGVEDDIIYVLVVLLPPGGAGGGAPGGGILSFPSYAARNALPMVARSEGMLAYILATAPDGPGATNWQLLPPPWDGTDADWAEAGPLVLQHGGNQVAARGTINLIDGANVTMVVADDPPNDRANVTISATGGGGDFAAPAFTAFAIAGVTGPLEVGATVPAGPYTANWATSNPANITPDSLVISDQTASTVLANGLADTGSAPVALSAISHATPTDHVWTIAGVDTEGGGFSRTYVVSWFYAVWTGDSAATTLDSNGVLGLAHKDLKAAAPGTYPISGANYKYLAYPDAMGDVVAIADADGNVPVALAVTPPYTNTTASGLTYAIVPVTNAFGIGINYRVYRTMNIIGGPLTLRVS